MPSHRRVIMGWTIGLLMAAGGVLMCEIVGASLLSQLGWTYLVMFLTGVVYNCQEDCSWLCRRWQETSTATNEHDLSTNLLAENHLPQQLEAEHEEEGEYREEAEATENGGLPQQGQEEEEVHSDLAIMATTDEEQPPQPTEQEVAQSPLSCTTRLHYLDNLRIFLVAIVVTGHSIGEAIGVFWQTVSVNQMGSGVKVPLTLVELWVPVVMPLFFGIAGYVTPTSFRRHGKVGFLKAKRNRLWLPAMVVSFTLVPAAVVLGQSWWLHHHQYRYLPLPDHCWFLFTLLMFQWMHSTFQKDNHEPPTNDEQPPPPKKPFPTFRQRFCYGLCVAGLATSVGVILLRNENLSLGAWPLYLLLFWAGVQACENDWLDPSNLVEHMPTVRKSVVVQVILLCSAVLCFLYLPDHLEVLMVGFLWVAGVASLDMSLWLVHCFQTYANTPWPSFWKTSAYAVYLIHKLILRVIAISTAFVLMEKPDDHGVVGNKNDSHDSLTVHQKWLGLVVVVVGTHLISWPVAWGLARLPIVRQVL